MPPSLVGPLPHFALALGLSLGAGGCFGDWVSASPRPKREAPATVDADSEGPTVDPTADPCGAYRSAVARRCRATLAGRPQTGTCHADLIAVMALYEADADPAKAECAQRFDAMPPLEQDGPTTEMGPECTAWGDAIAMRCVTPLSRSPPGLEGCGPDLLAFESTLGALAYGRPSDHEAQCATAAKQLALRP